MKRFIRPATPGDASAMGAFFAEAGLPIDVDSRHMHWKYWQPRADRPGPRSYVLVDDSGIVAHGGLVPGSILWGDERIELVQMIDWVARPDALGAGVSLMKDVARLVDGLLSIGGDVQTTRRLLPHIGFRSYGEATGYVRPLHPLRSLGPGAEISWRLLPRLARRVLWRLTAPSGGIADWQVRRVDASNLHHLAAALPAPARGMAVLERSEGQFEYMLSCPIVPLELHALEKTGRAHGYFLLARAPGQVRLADCWMNSDDPADWRSLVQCAVQQGMRYPDAAEMVTWSNDALLSRCLAECGFHARMAQPVQLMLRNGRVLSAPTLRVQMLDADAIYLDHARMTLWA
jgi:hypothetical protein